MSLKKLSLKKKLGLILLILSLCILFIIYLLFQVIQGETGYTPADADAIIILGHAISSEGEPQQWLSDRLMEGLRLYEDGYSDILIVSGGEGPFDSMAVALSMANWLMSKGVDPENIYMEDQSKNTYENFKFTKALAEAEDLQINSVIVVTNDFHMYRSVSIAELFFDQVSGSAAALGFSMKKLLAYIKEPLSIIKYRIVDIFAG